MSKAQLAQGLHDMQDALGLTSSQFTVFLS